MTAILILIIVILALRIYAYKMELKALKRYMEKTSRFPEKKEIEACVEEVMAGKGKRGAREVEKDWMMQK